MSASRWSAMRRIRWCPTSPKGAGMAIEDAMALADAWAAATRRFSAGALALAERAGSATSQMQCPARGMAGSSMPAGSVRLGARRRTAAAGCASARRALALRGLISALPAQPPATLEDFEALQMVDPLRPAWPEVMAQISSGAHGGQGGFPGRPACRPVRRQRRPGQVVLRLRVSLGDKRAAPVRRRPRTRRHGMAWARPLVPASWTVSSGETAPSM